MKGLIIKPYWADMILRGDKTWEIRGKNTDNFGRIAIIKSGSGMIYGEAELYDSFPLNERTYRESQQKHRIEFDFGMLWYKKPHAWALRNVVEYEKPIPYNHPQGAVIWVNLPEVIGA